MPHYNIWIRETDNQKWLDLDNRSEWLHSQLNNPQTAIYDSSGNSNRPIFRAPIKTPKDAIEAIKEVFPEAKPIPKVEVCKGHDSMRFNCGKKGCKY